MTPFTVPNFPPTTDVYAVDFESSYATGRDIKSLGVWPYLRHKDTQIYLVSIYGPGVSYSGPLETAPWHQISGKHWISHNAGFDYAVYVVACERGQIPDGVYPCEWDCTANLAAFCGANRSLAGAVAAIFDVKLSKVTRDEMKGQRWETMTPEFQAECIRYALDDAKWCWEIWDSCHHNWPAQEVAASRHTLLMCSRGVAIDLAYVADAEAKLKHALWETEGKIPWAGELDVKGKEIKITSTKALKDECVKIGIPAPLSTADKNEIFDKWLAEYEDRAPFVAAVKAHRSINRTLDVVGKFRERTQADGRMQYELKYFGGHTGRWSGGGGNNLQNITKKPVAGVDLRGCIYPAPGKKFIVADLSQIEARVALWYAEDWAQLELLRNGMDVYEAHARATMGYNQPGSLKEYCAELPLNHKDKKMRDIAKARVLGLGFGMGHVRLIDFAKTLIGINLSVAEAKQIVNGFRNANKGIVKMWDSLHSAMENHAMKHRPKAVANFTGSAAPALEPTPPFSIELPSWRSLDYYDVSQADGLKAKDERGGLATHWFGGKLYENLVQATARDILVEAILRIEEAGYPVVLHVHDEVICEVPLDTDPEVIRAMMTVTPEWAPGLPIGSSSENAERYFK